MSTETTDKSWRSHYTKPTVETCQRTSIVAGWISTYRWNCHKTWHNILTDDGRRIFETSSDLLGLSLQTKVCSALAWGRSEVRISAKFCFYCGNKQAEAAGQSVHAGDHYILYNGSSTFWMTDTWNEPLFPSGRCGFDAMPARSAVDVSSLE